MTPVHFFDITSKFSGESANVVTPVYFIRLIREIFL
jgi:hypothetical protein